MIKIFLPTFVEKLPMIFLWIEKHEQVDERSVDEKLLDCLLLSLFAFGMNKDFSHYE